MDSLTLTYHDANTTGLNTYFVYNICQQKKQFYYF